MRLAVGGRDGRVVLECNPLFGDKRFQFVGVVGRIARGLRKIRQRPAVGLFDVLSRDSATHHGNAAVVAEGDTCMARIRGARGDTVRTGLLRLFKNPLARSGSRKPPVNPAAFDTDRVSTRTMAEPYRSCSAR